MGVQSLGRKDALEEEIVSHSSILARKIPWTVEPGGLQSMGSQRAGWDWACTQVQTRIEVRIYAKHETPVSLAPTVTSFIYQHSITLISVRSELALPLKTSFISQLCYKRKGRLDFKNKIYQKTHCKSRTSTNTVYGNKHLFRSFRIST